MGEKGGGGETGRQRGVVVAVVCGRLRIKVLEKRNVSNTHTAGQPWNQTVNTVGERGQARSE